MGFVLPEKPVIERVEREDGRKFCVVPLRAFREKRLSLSQLRILGLYASYCNNAGMSFVSCTALGRDYGCSKSYMALMLQKIEKVGYIVRVKKHGVPGIRGCVRRMVYDTSISTDDAIGISQSQLVEPIHPLAKPKGIYMTGIKKGRGRPKKVVEVNTCESGNKVTESTVNPIQSGESLLNWGEVMGISGNSVRTEEHILTLSKMTESGITLTQLRVYLSTL
jgi:hypothetical protein